MGKTYVIDEPEPVPQTVHLSNFAIDPSTFLTKESTVPAQIGMYQGFRLFGFPQMPQVGELLSGIIT
jgi:hypothetical protein